MIKKIRKITSLSRDEQGSVHIPTHPHWSFGFNNPYVEGLIVWIERWARKLDAFLANITIAQFALAVATPLSAALAVYGANFSVPSTTHLSYASSTTCMDNFVLFPGMHTVNQSDSFSVDFKDHYRIGNFSLASRTTCVEPVSDPRSFAHEKIEIGLLGSSSISKQIQIVSGPQPSVVAKPDTSALLPVNSPAEFTLSERDVIFDYVLRANKKVTDCELEPSNQLICPVNELELKQSNSYQVTLRRHFNGEPVNTVFTAKYTTTEALKSQLSSISNDSVVYNKPSEISLKFNKQIANFTEPKLTTAEGAEEIAIETKISGRHLIIIITEELPRQRSFALNIENVTAKDGSSLPKPYSLKFRTSGGPKVLATNLGSSGFSQNNPILLTFDSPIASNQNMAKYVDLSAGGKSHAFTTSLSGNQLTIIPTKTLPWCSNISVSIADGFKSTHSISGGSASSHGSRTICYQTLVVGYSHQGRAILAYKFGSGSQNIVMVGGTHGDEPSSTYILNSFLNDLDSKYSQIPKSRSVYIVPTINPDGLATGSRTNARGVDLNRNFPANDWKKDVKMPDQSINKGGGGSAPLSEPESAAIASFVLSLNPRTVLTYHAVGGLVIANESGNSMSLAQNYGNTVGYAYLGDSALGGTFNYDTTGAFENWLHDKHAIPTLLIELWSYYGNEFYTHSHAVWAIIRN